MLTEHRAVAALRVFLVVLFGILVLFQTMSLPGQFAHMAQESPDMAYLRWPAAGYPHAILEAQSPTWPSNAR